MSGINGGNRSRDSSNGKNMDRNSKRNKVLNSVLNGYIQQKSKSKKKSAAEEKDLLKRVKDCEWHNLLLQQSFNTRVALIWNLELQSGFDSKDARFNAVCKFLNDVIGKDKYSEFDIDSCEWLNSRKNILQVVMSVRVIDNVLKNEEKFKDFIGKNGQKIRFERKKTIGQIENAVAAKELSKRLLDHLYLMNNSNVSKTPKVYARNGKIQIRNHGNGRLLKISEVLEEFSDIDFKKPLNLCINPFDKNRNNDDVAEMMAQDSDIKTNCKIEIE